MAHSPTLHKAVVDLVTSDTPRFAKDSTSLREETVSTRNLSPSDLPFVTFDVASLGILQALPIAYWKAEHVGMQQSTRFGKEIPIVEPVAVWNKETARVPVCDITLGKNNVPVPGNVIGHHTWLPDTEVTFTAAHVAAITECGHLFTHELDTSTPDGSNGPIVNEQFKETGPYINFGFVDGDHRNATLDNVIYGVHSKAWHMMQNE